MTYVKPLGKWISVLHRYQLSALSRRLRPMGIGPGQYPILVAVCNSPGVRQDELAEELFLNKSSVGRAAYELERHGHLTRTPDPADKRALRLTATEKGLRGREEILRNYDIINQEMTEGFSEEEKQQLYALLLRASENVAGRR